MRKIFSLTAALTILSWPLLDVKSAGGRTVAAESSLQTWSLSRLRNGHHQVCMPLPSQEIACFWFRKKGQQITGTYFYPRTESGICLQGRISSRSNTLRGTAKDLQESNTSPAGSAPSVDKLPGRQLVNWIDKPENKLQLAEGQALAGNQTIYKIAKLSLPSRLYYVPQTSSSKIAMPKSGRNSRLLGWDYEPPGAQASFCLKS